MEAHSRGGLGLGTGLSLVLLAALDTCADFLNSHFSHLQKRFTETISLGLGTEEPEVT